MAMITINRGKFRGTCKIKTIDGEVTFVGDSETVSLDDGTHALSIGTPEAPAIQITIANGRVANVAPDGTASWDGAHVSLNVTEIRINTGRYRGTLELSNKSEAATQVPDDGTLFCHAIVGIRFRVGNTVTIGTWAERSFFLALVRDGGCVEIDNPRAAEAGDCSIRLRNTVMKIETRGAVEVGGVGVVKHPRDVVLIPGLINRILIPPTQDSDEAVGPVHDIRFIAAVGHGVG